jgi:hypothetical protein
MSDLSNAIKKLAASGLMACMNGEIISVDKTEMTCEVSFGDEDSVVASLVCGDKKKGIVQVPKIGSNVVVMFYSPTVAFVVMVDEVEEILINGGENGGLVNVEELKSWMSNVESDLSTLNTLLSTSTVAGNGAALGIVFNPATKNTEIEDKTIKH